MLEKLRDAASSLEAVVLELEERDVWTRQLLEVSDASSTPDLLDHSGVYAANLAAAAGRGLEKLKRGGRPAEEARLALVYRLAEIFDDATAERPARRHDWRTGKEYGRFSDFVAAILEPLDPSDLDGIQHVIRKAVREYGEDRGHG